MTTSNGYAGKDALLKAAARRYRDVEVDGLKFRVQSISEGERSAIETDHALAADDDKKKRQAMQCYKSRFIVSCLVDGQGNRIFADNDVETVKQMDSRITNRLMDAIEEHIGISAEDSEALAKNSTPTGGDALE